MVWYWGVVGLIFYVVGGCAVDAGVVDAAEHQHLVVGLVAETAGLVDVVHPPNNLLSYRYLHNKISPQSTYIKDGNSNRLK